MENTSKSYNLTQNNKRKINKNNLKNSKNINIIINQNLSNSTGNIANNFKKVINKNNNGLNGLNSYNKKVMINPKNINLKYYKIINKSPTNTHKKGGFILSKPCLYKSRFKNLSIITQGKNTKSGLIKRIKFSEYKPIYNTKQKSDILYNNKDNKSKQMFNSKSNIFFNPIKELKDMSNTKNIITVEEKRKLPYKYSFNNIYKNSVIYNIPNNFKILNLIKRLRILDKSDSFNISNNEINFGFKHQKNYKEKCGTNNSFRIKNNIKSFFISPKIII